MEEWNLLIIKFLTNECTTQEKEDLEKWLQLDVEHDAYFKKIKKIWEHTEINVDNVNPDVKRALKMIHAKIESENSSRVVPFTSDFSYYAKRIAAVIILGTCIGWSVYFIREKIVTQNITEFKAGGERTDIVLSDGTKVWLNKHSSIHYPDQFKNDIREIYLEGEAYFDVTKDAQKPFVIHSQNSVTQVIGTSFNVRALSGEDNVLVTVTSGRVAFYEQSNEMDKVYLIKGERGILTKQTHLVMKEKNTDMNFLAWQTGKLIFSDTPLDEAVAILSRHYNKSITITGHAAHCRFTSTFNNQSLAEVMEELSVILNIEIKNKDASITVTGQGC